MVIENERLKNTIALLNQKLKVQAEEERKTDRLKKQIKDLQEEVDEANESRNDLKQTIAELEEKYVAMEEEVFEMQNT